MMRKFSNRLLVSIMLFLVVLAGLSSKQSSAQWQLSNANAAQWSMVTKDTSVLAGTLNGIYFTDDDGTTWTLKSCPAPYVRSIVVKDSIIFITGDNDGVYKSIDNGASWISIDSGIANPGAAWSLTRNDSLLILGTSGTFAGDTAAIYISSDDGNSWTKVLSLTMFDVFYSFAVSGNEVFAGVLPSGLFYSNDKGITWTLMNGVISAKHIALAEDILLCGITGGSGGIYLSTDKGTSWLNVLPLYYGYAFATSGNLTFAGTSNGFYYSMDNGYTWINDNDGLPPVTGVISICATDSFVFIGTDDAEIYRRNIADIATGLNDLTTPDPDFVVFPNPFINEVSIQNNSNQLIQFTLYNSWGDRIIIKSLMNKTSVIDLSSYPAGIYFYSLTTEKSLIKTGKIVKQ